MPHSTLLSSIASDMSVSFIKAVRSHMVTYNKTASKAAGTAPCQNHLLQSSPITIPSAFSGAARCPRRGRAREGRGLRKDPQLPPRPSRAPPSPSGGSARPRRHCPGAPRPRPLRAGRQPLGSARGSPGAHWPDGGDGRGASSPRRAARPLPFPWRRERRWFRAPGNCGGHRESGCGLAPPKTVVMLRTP